MKSIFKRGVRLIIGLFLFLISPMLLFTQDSLFITRSGSSLILDSKPFYVIGVNSYFLQNLVAYGDTIYLNEIFQEAKQLGVTTIRTWGFFDNADSNNAAVIQYLPGRFNEHGLQALDRVIAKAKEYSIRLIIPLVNNWEDYGGMNQYVRWYSQMFPTGTNTFQKAEQKIIKGAEGRYYRFFISNSHTHEDFYTNTTIKQWYRDYAAMLLNRVNTITNVKYKDEPAILAWELANEARSSDRTGSIVANWMDEMSTFIKSIDPNHLISSGDEGLDVSTKFYSDVSNYNDQLWLFDGSGGSSFRKNISLSNIDIGSIHCYPESWGLTADQAVRWLTDHNQLANDIQKPMILGEVGKKYQQNLFFNVLFNEVFAGNTAGILIWQFVYDGRLNNDGYAFTYPADSAICDILQRYAERFEQRQNGNYVSPPITTLCPNYPNPFNAVTLIPYDLSVSTFVRINIFNITGQCIATLVSDEQSAGSHLTIFEAAGLSGGTYFIHLIAHGNIQSRKILLLK